MWWRISLIAVVAFVLGCSGTDNITIKSPEDYQEISQQVYDLTNEPIAGVESGHPLPDVERDQLEEALKLLEVQIEFDPARFEPYAIKGRILRTMDDYEGARTAYENAVTRLPKNPTPESIPYIAEMYYDVSVFYFMNGKYEESLKYAQQAEDTSPAGKYQLMMARCEVELRQIDEAKERLAVLIEKDSQIKAEAETLMKFIEVASAESPTKTEETPSGSE